MNKEKKAPRISTQKGKRRHVSKNTITKARSRNGSFKGEFGTSIFM